MIKRRSYSDWFGQLRSEIHSGECDPECIGNLMRYLHETDAQRHHDEVVPYVQSHIDELVIPFTYYNYADSYKKLLRFVKAAPFGLFNLRIETPNIRRLLGSDLGPRIHSMRIRCRMSLGMARDIANSPNLHNLKGLDCLTTGRGLSTLYDNQSKFTLQKLDLRSSWIEDDVLGLLLEWDAITSNLTSLKLSSNYLTNYTFDTIFCDPRMSDLVELLLDNAMIEGSLFGETLREHTLKSLQKLHLGENWIEDVGVEKLVKVTFPNLRVLHLNDNNLTNDSVDYLLEASRWPSLEELYIADNEISVESLIRLSRQTNFTNLKEVEVGGDYLLQSDRQILVDSGFRGISMNRLVKLF